MRIVLLNDDALPQARGGAAVVVERLRRAYAAAGHEVALITTHQEGEERRERADDAGRIIRLPIRYDLRERHRRCIHNPDAVEQMADMLRRLRPDTVHAHNIHTYLTYESLLMAREHTDRIVLTAHDTFLVSFGRTRGNSRLTIPDHIAAAGRRYRPFGNRRIRHILRASGTRVVAISHVLASFLGKNGIAAESVIHNGVEVSPPPAPAAVEAFRMKHGIRGPTILFGGRVSGDKGIGALLMVFAIVRREIPEVQLLIVGDRERAEKYVMGRSGVVLAGHLPQEEMPLAFAASDVVTTPSLYLDPFNLMNIEAMAAGKPVVGTCFGGTPEIVVDGETGLIVDPRNAGAFAGALIALLRDPAKAEAMGERGRQRVRERFSLAKQAQAYLGLLSGTPG